MATTTKKRPRNSKRESLPFPQRLVLNQFFLSLFGVENFQELAQYLKDPQLEGFDEDNTSRFYYALVAKLPENSSLSKDILLGYDQNIVSHTLAIRGKREIAIKWKYFQYLSLLFTEIYLDRYFRNPEQLLQQLNETVTKFNHDKADNDQVNEYQLSDLKKLAFWNATGSGKTLLMHINILQYQHYIKLHGKSRNLNRIILLTPNEGLSQQHLEEFALSGIQAELFSKAGRSLFTGKAVEIIDINKLRDEMGEKTVAVDAFEDNNLVMVDEGHRGSSGEEWKSRRDKLCENGFSFEYSATFGQAIKASNKPELVQEYAKCIIFDYSYKYFYQDGYGKDYRILNLADDKEDESRKVYLSACLLTFFQQQLLYLDKKAEFQSFLIEKPLWVFVGGSVNAVRTQNRRQVSDVVDILLFLAEFVNEPSKTIARLERILSGNAGLLDKQNRDIFTNTFTYLREQQLTGELLFNKILEVLFNAPHQAKLHIEHIKGDVNELALQVGNNKPFGVVNVGDAAKLKNLCKEHSILIVEEKEFGESLFNQINDKKSTVNILIGSKKFTEGWNSYRVSTMGLMNIGRGEGSEIIQLFGRGVRLKGYNFSLKRSREINTIKPPKYIETVETLNIFGIRADYMQQFQEYLEAEGLPTNESRIEIILPVIKNLGTQNLKIMKPKEGIDFKTQAPKPVLGLPSEYLQRNKIILNWYPKIQASQSDGISNNFDAVTKNEAHLTIEHIGFLTIDEIFLDLQRFKDERGWYNLNIPYESILNLLNDHSWYSLQIPPQALEFTSFDQVKQWQEIAIALLKKYCDRFYKSSQSAWEAKHLELQTLTENDPNFFDNYKILIDESQQEIINTLNRIKDDINNGNLKNIEFQNLPNLKVIHFNQHLYQPLIYINSEYIDMSPVSLNEGERDFIIDLQHFYNVRKDFFKNKELYLLRNQSRGKGVGFFEAGNFHPDFILWILLGEHQYINFVDPKGLRNVEGINDRKIQFYRTIKEINFNDENVTLNSFIVSNTKFATISWWGKTKEELETYNLLFQEDKETYVEKLLNKAIL
jgi:hypothetical protein